MMKKIAAFVIACLTITLVVASGNIIPKTFAQQPKESQSFEKFAQSASQNATGTEKTFVALISCNTAHPDFSKPLEGVCDFTTLVPAP